MDRLEHGQQDSLRRLGQVRRGHLNVQDAARSQSQTSWPSTSRGPLPGSYPHKFPASRSRGHIPVTFENGRAFLHSLEGKAFQHAWLHGPLPRNVEQAQSTVAQLALRLRDVCPDESPN